MTTHVKRQEETVIRDNEKWKWLTFIRLGMCSKATDLVGEKNGKNDDDNAQS